MILLGLALPGLALPGLAVILGIWPLVLGTIEMTAVFRLRDLAVG